jgi:integrase
MKRPRTEVTRFAVDCDFVDDLPATRRTRVSAPMKARIAAEFREDIVWQSVVYQTKTDYERALRAIDAKMEEWKLDEESTFFFLAKTLIDGGRAGGTVLKYLFAIMKRHQAKATVDPWTRRHYMAAVQKGLIYRAGLDRLRRNVLERYPFTTEMVKDLIEEALQRREADVALGFRLLYLTGLRVNHLARMVATNIVKEGKRWVFWTDGFKHSSQLTEGLRIELDDRTLGIMQGQVKFVHERYQQRAREVGGSALSKGGEILMLPNWNASRANAIIRTVAARKGWSQGWQYTCHCFRAAFVRKMKEEGRTDDQIRVLGKWATGSKAYQRYRAYALMEGQTGAERDGGVHLVRLSAEEAAAVENTIDDDVEDDFWRLE